MLLCDDLKRVFYDTLDIFLVHLVFTGEGLMLVERSLPSTVGQSSGPDVTPKPAPVASGVHLVFMVAVRTYRLGDTIG